MKKILPIFILIALNAISQITPTYDKEIRDWETSRIKRLKAETGWLNLAGLYWLEEGKNTFGSSVENKIIFPFGKINSKSGYFLKDSFNVTLYVNDNIDIKVNGISTKEKLVFHPDSSSAPEMTYGDLKWSIIKRENLIGIRLRDLKSENVSNFKSIDRFPLDVGWRVKAKLLRDSNIKTIPIQNVLGQTIQEKTAGKLVFTINNIEYQLDALDEDEDLFIIFGDKTNGDNTYPSGRFLYAKSPTEENDDVVLDFNKAYNPPCAFTPFATCPIPPKQNILPIKITAGEKVYGH